MKRILMYITTSCLMFASFSSCKKDITSLNENPKLPSNADAGTLFANAQKKLTDILTTPSQFENICRLFTQYWAETTYIDESNYANIMSNNIPGRFWNVLYANVLKDLYEAKKLINASNAGTDAIAKNKLAFIDILIVYTYSVLVDTYGNVPYSEALNVENIHPKYDDASTIYNDLLVKLDAAINSLDISKTSFGVSDIIYKGDIDRWKKFANSIKLRMGMRLVDVPGSNAKNIVEQAVQSGVFQSNADGAMFTYSTVPPNTNPIWENLIRNDFVAAQPFVDTMNALNDPRRMAYFTKVGNAYIGGKYGSQNNYVAFSHVGDRLIAENMESFLMEYTEVEFLLAEAVERGFAVGGTAEGHYKSAITASMQYWNVPQSDIDAYLLQPAVAYSTATGDYKQKIGTQKWIAFYNRPFEAWCEWKRLDYPVLVKPANAASDIPKRLRYPVREQNLNKEAYDQAAGAIPGGDLFTSKVFWD